jgi:hydrogenase/urease accessory protein HupE
MTTIQALFAIFVLAVLVEATVEYLFVPVPTVFKPYIAAVLGVVVCLAYGADLPAALGLPPVAYVGPVVTGLVIGRGSNYLNDLVSRLKVITAPAQPVDSVEGDS